MSKQIRKKELVNYIHEQAQKLIEADEIKAAGEPTDVVMNKMVDGASANPEAKVKNVGGKEETKSAKVAAEDPMNVSMNQMDKEAGSDGKAASAVKVEAGGDLSSDQSATAGQKAANFDSKKSNPSKESGEPFDENGDAKMNSMDKEGDEGTKTFVGAKGNLSSDQATNVGMNGTDVHEDAQNEAVPEKIAKAIEMPKEGFTFKDKNELLEWTKGQAAKIADLL
jgi:hypothetical protein